MNENDLNQMLEGAIKALFLFFASFFKSCWYGIKYCLNRRRKGPRIALAIIIALSALVLWQQRSLHGLILHLHADTPPFVASFLFPALAVFVPLVYLYALGQMRAKDIQSTSCAFETIQFRGKDGNYPVLVSKKEDGKKTVFTFRSSIPLENWRKAQGDLETALDCTILHVQQGKSKRDVRVVAVSSDFSMPTMIEWKDEYISETESVISIGVDALEPVTFDLNRTPHVLAAGETGSGKSVILRTMLWQMAARGAVLYMVDFKGGVEFGKVYEQYGEVVTDRKRALVVLHGLVAENTERLAVLRQTGCKNIKEYNASAAQPWARIVLVVDEIAEMLDTKGADKETKELMLQLNGALSTLARLSRATGINMFIGVQRPDANVLTGQIKNNIPVRICGRFADKPASEIVLGTTDAVFLPDIKGRFLFKQGADVREFQSFYFDDERMLRPISAPKGRVLVSSLTEGISSPSTPKTSYAHYETFDASPPEDEGANTPPYTEEETDPGDPELDFNF